MDDAIQLVLIIAFVAVSIFGSIVKKAADKRKREEMQDKERTGKPDGSRPSRTRSSYYRQKSGRAAAPRQARYDEEAFAKNVATHYKEHAVKEISREHATPSYDMQFKGDTAIGEVGETRLLSRESASPIPEALCESGFIGKEFSKALGEPLGEPGRQLGDIEISVTADVKHTAKLRAIMERVSMRHAVILREILGPPKALQ